MVREGHDVHVVDANSGHTITASVPANAPA